MGTLMFFLSKFPTSTDYAAYLEAAVAARVDFVRIDDCKNLLDYMTGVAASAPQLHKPRRRTRRVGDVRPEIKAEEESDDDDEYDTEFPLISKESKRFGLEVANVIESLVDREDGLTEEAARQRLETLLAMLSSAGYDLARLKMESVTAAGRTRASYERALWQPMMDYYRWVTLMVQPFNW